MNQPIRILVCLALGLSCGCQGSNRPTIWTGDERSVSEVIDDWNDVDKSNTAAAAALFAKDVQPSTAQVKVFRQYNIMHNGPPKITGTTAKMPVLIYTPSKQATPVPLEWAFEKEGEAWKIKAAPLP